ncbi:MAG: ribosome silencing factor [Clostridia bacterium]|nr:ribosome silencing factor [Clostridia bacterium]
MENNEVMSLVGADSRTIAEAIVKVLDDKKARDIKMLKVDEKTTMTDYFVVCTATSTTQVKSLCGEVEFQLGEMGITPAHSDGMDTGNWAALDYLHVILHVFLQGERDFYKLEKMWSDGEVIEPNK